jgi:FAD-linked sulfhydryl oxidase
MARPPLRLLGLAIGTVLTVFFLYFEMGNHPPVPRLNSNPLSTSVDDLAHISPGMQKGNAIMGHLGNETIKADLGRAAWKLFHTTMARFPDQPSEEESSALKSYIYLFARLYPCGECASHFQKILKKFPPQTSSRSTAAAWGCHVHNEVNKSKGKPIFDCANIGDSYDCGCGDDVNKEASEPQEKGEMSELAKTKMVQDGRDLNLDLFKPVQIAKEGPTKGG